VTKKEDETKTKEDASNTEAGGQAAAQNLQETAHACASSSKDDHFFTHLYTRGVVRSCQGQAAERERSKKEKTGTTPNAEHEKKEIRLSFGTALPHLTSNTKLEKSLRHRLRPIRKKKSTNKAQRTHATGPPAEPQTGKKSACPHPPADRGRNTFVSGTGNRDSSRAPSEPEPAPTAGAGRAFRPPF